MFDEFFEVVLADDGESRDAHYRLRFQVYCRETGFENPTEFPDRLERDEFDESSVPFLVRSRVTGEWVAAMRLVVGSVRELPVAEFLDSEYRDDPFLAAEISRFCVSPSYRRRTSREVCIARPSPKSRVPSPDHQPVVSLLESRDPWILIGLLRAARQYGQERSITRWFFLAADSMAAAVAAAGFSTSPAGPQVEHRGLRRAYRFHWNAAEAGLALRSPHVARMFGRRPAYRLASDHANSSDSPSRVAAASAGSPSKAVS